MSQSQLFSEATVRGARGLVVVACFALALLVAESLHAQQAPTTLPSMKFLAGPLVSPSAAQSSYGSGTAHSSSFAGVSGFEGRPPEIVELARALKNDPDLIYEFVRNHIDTEFAFGLRKGALGSLIDKSGTPFDQNVLFVETVRQAGYTARYKIGQVTLSGAVFTNWMGVNDAQAACKMLASAGIPAAINGLSPSDCSVSGAITSVMLLHVWSEVLIGGSYYAFDPSLKTRSSVTGRDLVVGSGFASGAATAAAETTVVAGAQSGVPFIKSVNATGLDSYLQTRGTQLLNDLRASAYSSDTDTVLGIPKIAPTYKPVGGWRNATPQGYTSTSGAVVIAGDIPDQYRTTLRVRFQAFTTADYRLDRLTYTDEIYGRRFGIDTNFDQDHNINDNNPAVWYPEFSLEVDDVALQTGSCLPYPPGWIECPLGNGPEGPLSLVIDHPYAANNGTFADQTITKQIEATIPVAIVLGFGRVSPALQAKWSGELAHDKMLPRGGHPPFPCGAGDLCVNAAADPAGDLTRQTLAAGWLSQLSRMLELQSAIGQARAEHHHSLGVVGVRARLQGFQITPGTISNPAGSPILYGMNDTYTSLDIDTSLSITSSVNSAARVAAISRSVAVAAATLEGSLLEQSEDLPDTASTASRFAWANTPDNEDPCNTGARRFYDFTATTSATRAGLLIFEGSSTGCGAGPTIQFVSNPADYWKSRFETVLNKYLTIGGFRVTSSEETFLGPGARFGQVDVEHATNGVDGLTWVFASHEVSRQRGGALIATKTDASGSVLEVAHVLSNYNAAITKGGGGKEPENAGTYDPSKAADLLRDRFVDRSTTLGVDLNQGTVGYSTPTLLNVGNGDASFALDYKLLFKNGATGCTPYGQCTSSPQGGWTHNWDIRFSHSGSGHESLGRTSPLAASGSLVAFMAMQDIFAQAGLSDLKKDIYSSIAADWWRRQMLSNVATVTQGFSGRQYVRLVDGTWMSPPGTGGTLTQTGQRTKVRDVCRTAQQQGDPTSVNRRWSDTSMTFTLTEANGQVLSFAPWAWNYNLRVPCRITYGFKIVSWAWPQGQTLTFATDAGGAVTSVTSSAGRTLSVTPPFPAADPTNGLTSASSAGLTALRSLTGAVTDASGAAWNFDYAPVLARSATQRPVPYTQLAHVFEPTNATLPALEYVYDTRGLVKEAKDGVALQWYPRRQHQFFIAEGARGERQDPQGATAAGDGRYVVYFDRDGNAVRHIDELGREVQSVYDGRHRVIERTMPEGDKAQFLYDARDNVIKLTRKAKPSACAPTCPPDQVVEAAYHATWNKPLWVKDQLGRQTDFTYFDTGNGKSLMATALRPSVAGTRPTYSFSYDALGRVLSATDPTGLVVQSTYDGINGTPLSTVTDPGTTPHIASTIVFYYDAVGNVIQVTDPRGNIATTTYDGMRRKLETKSYLGATTAAALGAATRFTYDALGRQIKEERATAFAGAVPTYGHVTQVAYTPTGQQSRVTDADGRITSFAYDGIDRLIRTTDPEGRVTGMVYDLASQVLKEQRGLGTPLVQDYAVYTHSSNGQKLTVKDAKNNQTSYTYDGFDRLSRTTFPGGTYEDLSYDAVGNVLSKLTRGGQLIQNTYDTLDRMVTHLVPQPGAAPAILTSTTYDLAGRATQISDNTGHVLAFAFDTAKRPASVTQTAPGVTGTRTVAYQLDAAGNKTRATWADGYYVSYAFDALGRMTTATENGTFVLATYLYNPLSRRTSLVTGNGATKAYSYTTQGDLLTLAHTMTGTTNTYTNTFTKAHQLASENLTNAAWGYVPAVFQTTAYAAANALNQYVNVTVGAAPAVTMAYDANGNLTGDGTWTFAYDAQNILRSANKAGSANSYLYDPMGRRQAKSANGVVTTYLSDGDEEIAEYSASALLRRYVPGPGTDQPIAMVTPSGASNTHAYFHTNRQGSVVAMSADNGTLSEGPYKYDAYGNGAPTTGVPFKYTGRRLDAETGLYFYRARYYSASLGRFLQVDPVGYGDDMNLYGYVGNDPTNASDPSGRSAWTKIAKLIIHGGDVAATVAGTVDDINTLTDSNASAFDRGMAAISLLSEFAPVGLRDVREGVELADKGFDALRRTCCFVAGTLVSTDKGLRAIETIKVGDLVLSRDEVTGETALKPVTDLIRRHDRIIWKLTLAGKDDTSKAISAVFETSDDHPWRTTAGTWVKTMDLKPGVEILRARGPPVAVISVENTGRSQPTYNLEIVDYHTYFVGEQQVWVHNNNCNIATNAATGKVRQTVGTQQVQAAHPSASVQSEQYLRDANGKIVKDNVTGQGRRVDAAAIDPATGRAQTYEITGPNVDKAAQQSKEGRILNQGGTFVRDRNTGNLCPVNGTCQRINVP